MGTGNGRPHIINVFDVEPKDGGPSKISIDYMHLNYEEAKKDQFQMVMVHHGYGRVFSYTVPKINKLSEKLSGYQTN